jgi:hypothetical protein
MGRAALRAAVMRVRFDMVVGRIPLREAGGFVALCRHLFTNPTWVSAGFARR